MHSIPEVPKLLRLWCIASGDNSTNLVRAGKREDEQADHEIGSGEGHDETVGRRASELGVREHRCHHEAVAYDDRRHHRQPVPVFFSLLYIDTASDPTRYFHIPAKKITSTWPNLAESGTSVEPYFQ